VDVRVAYELGNICGGFVRKLRRFRRTALGFLQARLQRNFTTVNRWQRRSLGISRGFDIELSGFGILLLMSVIALELSIVICCCILLLMRSGVM